MHEWRGMIWALGVWMALVLAATSVRAEPRTMVVGVENQNYRPLYWVESDGYHSYFKDLLDAFGEREGIRFVYRPLPVNRLYSQFLEGSLDFKFPDNPLWKADLKQGHQITYSAPVMDFIDGVMVTPQRKGQGLAKLKVLGTVLGFTPWEYLNLIKNGQVGILENASLPGLLEQVILGRVDGAYFNPQVARYQLEQVMNKPGALVFDPDLPHTKGAYLVSSIQHPELIGRFTEFMAREKDLVDQLKRSHGLAR